MSFTVPLHAIAEDLCHREWERCFEPALRTGRQADIPFERLSGEVCPAKAVLPELIELVRACHDRPVHELKPTIRRMIEERHFTEESGDPVSDAGHHELLEHYVELCVHVLERVRRHALTHGHWSSAPTPAQMFG